MKRLLATVAAAALVAGTGSEAKAQTAPIFDLGLYGGLQYSTNWFEVNDEGFGVGFGPIFGAEATFWASPAFGVRLHGGYFPTGRPEGDDDSLTEADYALNNYLADLDLVFRPFSGGGLPLLSSAYAFLGGGALVTNVAGDPREGQIDCVPGYGREVCLSFDPSYATVGQGVVGLGWDWLPLSSGLGVFTELAVHGYDSPAHTTGTANVAEDKFAFTPRATLGLKFAFGGAPEVVPVAPMAPPPPPPPPPPAPPAPPATRQISVCVVQNGQLQMVNATFNPATGDTTVAGGGRFATTYPATAPNYAAGAPWFVQSDSISFSNQQYVRFGVTRVITPTTQLTRAGEFNGVPVFAEAGATAPYRVLYVPVRPGCEFQPFEQRAAIRPRG